MTGIFKANNPYNNFLLFLYAFLLKLPIFLHPQVPKAQQLDGFFYKALLNWMQPAGKNLPFIYGLITFTLLYLQAIGLNRLVNLHRLMQKPNYLTGMSYLLITSMFTEWYCLSSSLLVNTLLIWVLSGLCNLNNNPNPKSSLFNLGLIAGIATFFYFPAIAFLLLIIAALGITRPFRLPEWLMVLLGMLTPYYFLGAWAFLTDRWKDYHFPTVAVSVPRFHQTGWAVVAVLLILLSILAGIYFIRNNMRRQVLQARKSWTVIFLYVLVAVLVPFLNTSNNFDYWILVAVPISAITGAAFLYPEKKWYPLFMHWSMLLVAVIMGYFLS